MQTLETTLGFVRFLVVAVSLAAGLTGTHAAAPAYGADLTIYAYDSFVSEWGPGPKTIPKFEKKFDVRVETISVGDAGQVLNRAILEKNSPKADVILGIDNNMLARALGEGVLQPYRSPNSSFVPRELIFDRTYHVTPFDYGYFAVCYDSLKLTDPPKSLDDLLKPDYRSKIILEDPRTSSPGLGFLLWTVAVYGDGYAGYWEKLEANILTITEGWDSAYGLFTGGEAPMVLSYTTSPAYHVEYEKTTRYGALVFKEGNYLQIEGLGILKGAKNVRLARQFVDFALTEDFQSEIPLTNWMYPVNPKVKLPDSFRHAPRPDKTLSLDAKEVEKNGKRWIDGWLRAVGK